jgi:hypothetical protein
VFILDGVKFFLCRKDGWRIPRPLNGLCVVHPTYGGLWFVDSDDNLSDVTSWMLYSVQIFPVIDDNV